MSEYKVYPVAFEIMMDGEVEANVEGFDEHVCNVEIKTVVSRRTWPLLSLAIQKALDAYEDGVPAK